MKKNKLIVLSGMAFFLACQTTEQKSNAEESAVDEAQIETEEVEEKPSNNTTHFGKQLKIDDAISMKEFAELLSKGDSVKAKIKTVAEDVCQKKGCWMKVKTDDGGLMRVTFKDYGFFVPKDIHGKKVVLEGIAVRDTVSVEELRHFAEDGGESEGEIASITEAEITTSFIAEGVVIQN